MPILREKNIRTNADEVGVKVSFTKVDVKRGLISLCRMYYISDTVSIDTDEWSEDALQSYFREYEYNNFPKKVADMFAKWAVKTAIRTKLVIPSPDNPDRYLFSDIVVNHSC